MKTCLKMTIKSGIQELLGLLNSNIFSFFLPGEASMHNRVCKCCRAQLHQLQDEKLPRRHMDEHQIQAAWGSLKVVAAPCPAGLDELSVLDACKKPVCNC